MNGHPMNVKLLRCASALAVSSALALSSGCAVGPDFKRPDAPEAKGYTPEPTAPETVSAEVHGGEAQRFADGADIPGEWWALFHSKALNTLIEEALKNNADLQAAQAALNVARENYYAGQSVYYPSISANFTPSRNKNAVEPSPTLATFTPYFNLYTAQVNVAYTFDVFGANRRQVETLEAQSESQKYQLEATYLTLTSNIVAAAVQEASLRAQIAATEKIVDVETETLGILRRRLALGDVAGADVAAQETALAQSVAALPTLKKQLANSATSWRPWSGAFRTRSRRRRSTSPAWSCPRTCPSACRPSWSSNARTSVRPRRCSMPPAPRSASRSPTCCRRSR
jgi:outer membrane protein TolC